MNNSQKFDVIYTLLEGEPEKTYNLHRYEPDKMEALRLVWKSLKAQYGNPDHDPINEMQDRSEHR